MNTDHPEQLEEGMPEHTSVHTGSVTPTTETPSAGATTTQDDPIVKPPGSSMTAAAAANYESKGRVWPD